MRPTPRRVADLAGRTIVALGLAAAAGIALVRYTGLQERGFRMMGIAGAAVAFTLCAVLGTFAGSIVWLFAARPTRRAARWLVVALAPLLVLAHMTAPYLAGRIAPERADEGAAISVLAQNLWFQNPNASTTLDAALRRGADVVVLTEFTPEFEDLLDHGPDAGEYRETYPHQWRRTRSYGSGLAVLSSLPIERTVPIPLSAPAVSVTVRVATGLVDVWAIHPMAPSDRWGLGQWQHDYRVLTADARDAGPRTVIAGDFNASSGHRAFRHLLDVGDLRDAQDVAGGSPLGTWPTGAIFPPMMRLDHVVVGAGIGVERMEVLPNTGSDHRGVQSWLRVPES